MSKGKLSSECNISLTPSSNLSSMYARLKGVQRKTPCGIKTWGFFFFNQFECIEIPAMINTQALNA